jgi:hypothetical protein
LARIRYSVDSEQLKPWVIRVGKLMVNFSALEMESVLWLVQLTEEPSRVSEFGALSYKARINLLLEIAESRSCGQAWKKAMARSWNQTFALAHTRNQIAHNPVVFDRTIYPDSGPSNLMGVPNIRGAKSRRRKSDILSLQDVYAAINATTAVTQVLFELRHEWCAARDRGNVSSAPVPKYRIRKFLNRVQWRLSGLAGRLRGDAS